MHELSRSANHKFKFIPSRKSIVCAKTQKALTGLHPILNTCFWPRYNKNVATNNCSRPRNGPLMKSYLFKDMKPKKRKKGDSGSSYSYVAQKGKYFGIKIDKQIELSTTISVKYNLPCKFFYDKNVRKQYVGKLPLSVLKSAHLLHIFTKRFWKAVDELHWKPVATQVGVGCKKWNVATRIDVLALDDEQKERVIEVKVGYDGYYYKCTDNKMKYPFSEKEDCLYHQHMVQVAMTNELFKRTYRKSKSKSAKVGDPVVIRLTATNTYIYWLTDWIKAGLEQLKEVKAPLTNM